MKVVIIGTNCANGRYAYEAQDVTIGYGWFELLDGVDFDEDDVLEGDFGEFGELNVRKQFSDDTYHIFNEDYGMSLNYVLKKIRN